MNIALVTDIAERLCKKEGWSAPAYIDHGASAAVYRTEFRHKKSALKIYDPSFFTEDNAIIEESRIRLQQELVGHGCRYLVDVMAANQIPEDGTWYLLMEFCPWKSLERRLPDVPDAEVHSIVKQVVEAVRFLEKRDFVHRDIKPANIVVSDDFKEAKLLDFGVLRRIAHDEGSGTDASKFIATAQYSPPEFLTRDEEPGELGFSAINIYQIGALLHDLITKSAIFAEEKATKNKFILFKAVTEKMPRIISASVPPRLIALCVAALDKSPAARVASVTLDDFLKEADDLPTLRRRVAQHSNSDGRSAEITLSVWKNRIRSWGLAAARIEAESLGAVTIKSLALPQGQRWQLDFRGASAPIFLDIVRNADHLAIHVRSRPDEQSVAAVFIIDRDGPSLPETGISSALAAQYLYALDLAIAHQSPHSEGA